MTGLRLKNSVWPECLFLAHRVISLLRSNLVASGVKRTSITEPDSCTRPSTPFSYFPAFGSRGDA
jgi:hypothetical protein